jgi:uncharacterized protein with PIN domain
MWMKPRFLVDSMLGSLARWLRIGGYDTEYRRDADDDSLMEEASRTGRVLLTRDRVLVLRAKKRGVETILVEGEGDVEQLGALAAALGLELDTSNSRCPRCNGSLTQVDRDQVRDRVPEASLEAFDVFWVCGSCGGVYWRGSHWDQIASTLEEAENLLRGKDYKSL